MIDEAVRIQVVDNGIGIEPEYFEEIFSMFKRLNATYKKGSGIGLNIARNLIKRIDGEIYIVESNISEGTVFEISLPFEDQVILNKTA